MNFGLRICSAFLLFGLFSCAPQTEDSSSVINYKIIEEQSISWADCLSQKENHYLVFFHSETCATCQEMKGDVTSFACENILKTYFVDIDKPGNKINKCTLEEVTVGVSNVDDFKIAGTPTLIEVEEGITIANAPGKEKCLELLNSLRTNGIKDNN